MYHVNICMISTDSSGRRSAKQWVGRRKVTERIAKSSKHAEKYSPRSNDPETEDGPGIITECLFCHFLT